jgi:putative ABC transport system permease protein
MTALIQDLRYVARTLSHSPVFSVSVVVILALGIGAGASIFSLVDAYFLRPPPGVSDPDRLVDLRATRGEKRVGAMTYPDFADLRDRSRRFSWLMAYRSTVLDLGHGSETRRVQAALVSSNYFAVLGAGTARGRAFLPEEERHPQGEPVAVISDRLWRGLFDANPALVGKPVTLNGRRFTVVGVASAGFRGHTTDEAFDIWVPLGMFAVADPASLASIDSRVWRWLTVVGRLAPGVDLAQTQAEMTVLARQIGKLGPGNDGALGVSLEPTRPSLLADTYVGLLIASVGALFLIACANLSNLFLARASARRTEVATCLALGAPRRRVVQRFMTESVVLGLLGGAAGLLVATPTSAAMLAWSTAGVQEFPDAVDLQVTGTLVVFVLGLSMLSGIVLGLGPALRISRLDVAPSLKEGAGGRSASGSGVRTLLVVFQLSFSLVLLSGGGLLFQTLRQYQSLIPVPEPEQVLLLSLQPSHQQYDDARAREFYRQLLERVARLPGVRSASLARDVSLADASFFTERVAAGRAEPGADTSWTDVAYAAVAPGFFRTMSTALVSGRDFSDRDREGAGRVVIVNDTLARRLWPGTIPLGQLLWIDGERSGREVVGVAGDRPAADGPRPFIYEPLFQRYPWAGSRHVILVRTSGSPLALVPAAQREAAALDANLPLFNPRTLDREIAGRRFFERMAGAVVGGSGLLALLLATIGLYGVTSYWASQRTHEFGIRVAIGASAGDVFMLVVGQGMRLALVGVALGLLAALALNRVWASLLFGVRPADLTVLAGVSLLLVASTLVASYLPARQATKVDPTTVMRAE